MATAITRRNTALGGLEHSARRQKTALARVSRRSARAFFFSAAQKKDREKALRGRAGSDLARVDAKFVVGGCPAAHVNAPPRACESAQAGRWIRRWRSSKSFPAVQRLGAKGLCEGRIQRNQLVASLSWTREGRRKRHSCSSRNRDRGLAAHRTTDAQTRGKTPGPFGFMARFVGALPNGPESAAAGGGLIAQVTVKARDRGRKLNQLDRTASSIAKKKKTKKGFLGGAIPRRGPATAASRP